MSNPFATKEEKDWIRSILLEGPMEIVFTKKDGTERTMKCTLNPSLVTPYEKKSDKQKTVNEDVLPVFDLDKKEWRSFRFDSIISTQFKFKIGE